MKTLLFLAKGFETMEASAFIDVLGWARNDYGYDVPLVTCGFTKTVNSTFDLSVIVDKLIEEIQIEEYDALAIPGGFEEFGFYEEAYHEKLLELIRMFHADGKIIATICVAALPLGKSGVLNGKRATTYHLKEGYRQNQLREFGVEVTNEPIVDYENIITSYCPQTAPEVAFRLLEKLTSKEEAGVVRDAMGFEKNSY
ncbi:DJ-1/PfpI family protein [Lachnospiraceae bacterium LCP25S3_G4]